MIVSMLLCDMIVSVLFCGQIHNTELIVNKALDREITAQYVVRVAATDGGFVSYASVIITVLDDNDNSPVCSQVSAVCTR